MTNLGMSIPLMHTHASMQMERLQDGFAAFARTSENSLTNKK